jgi:hypothetical protein
METGGNMKLDRWPGDKRYSLQGRFDGLPENWARCQTPYTQPVHGQQNYQPIQGQGVPPPQIYRCQNCGNGVIYGANPCPYCRFMIKW